MSGRRSKVKGAVGEREAAAALREILGIDAERGRQYHGGPNSPDVKHSLAGVNIEVKRSERLSLYKALEQSRGDCGEGDIPVVLHRQNRQPWVVVVELKDLLELVRRINASKKPKKVYLPGIDVDTSAGCIVDGFKPTYRG